MRVINVLLAVGLVCLLGCQENPRSAAVKVGLLIPAEFSEDAGAITEAAGQAADEDGRADVVVKVAEPGRIKQAFEELTKPKNKSQAVSAVAVLAVPGLDLNQAIYGRVMAGVPVVLFNHDLPETNRDFFVPIDDRLAGELLGRRVLASGERKQGIAVVTGQLSSKSQLERLAALQIELQKSPGTTIEKTIRYKDDDQLKRELGELPPEIQAVASTGAWIFHAAVMPELKRFKGKLYAIANTPEAMQALKSGQCQVLVVGDLSEQAYRATRLCLSRLRIQTTIEPEPVTPVVLVAQDYWKEAAASTEPASDKKK